MYFISWFWYFNKYYVQWTHLEDFVYIHIYLIDDMLLMSNVHKKNSSQFGQLTNALQKVWVFTNDW